MSLRIVIPVISVAVLAAAGGFYVGSRNNAAPAPQAATEQNINADAEIKKLTDMLNGKPTEAAKAAEGQVVAVVGGENISKKDVEDLYTLLKQRSGPNVPPMDEIFWPLVDQIVSSRLVIQAATSEKLDTTADYARALGMAREQILQEAYVTKLFDSLNDDAKLKPLYDKMVEGMKGTQEVKAQHILVDEEAKAKDLIAQLKKGADFAKLAKENSNDPGTKDNGGDLGYFVKDAMVPEFANAAFALNKGDITETPVKSAFGWHVIKLEDKRERPAPSFEEAKPQLQAQARQELLQSRLTDLKEKGKVELKPADNLPKLAVEDTPAPQPEMVAPAAEGAAPEAEAAPKAAE
jgi:peptidyl-prolyl cis-trans isomerase C